MAFTYTIIIPYYNCQDYIDFTLKSIEMNEFDHTQIQILLIDDGSTKNLDIKNIGAKYKTLNIEFHKKDNGNWGSVINYCKHNSLVKGEYFTILDADDVLNNKVLNKAKILFEQYEPDAIVFDVAVYDKELLNCSGKIHTYTYAWSRLLKKNKCFFSPIGIPLAKFYRSKILYNTPDLLEHISYMDTPFFNYMMKNCSKVYYSKYVGGKYRAMRENSSMLGLSNNQNKFQELIRVQELLKQIIPNNAYNVLAISIFDNSFVSNFRKTYPESLMHIPNNFNFNFAGFWMRILMRIKLKTFFRKNKSIIIID